MGYLACLGCTGLAYSIRLSKGRLEPWSLGHVTVLLLNLVTRGDLDRDFWGSLQDRRWTCGSLRRRSFSVNVSDEKVVKHEYVRSWEFWEMCLDLFFNVEVVPVSRKKSQREMFDCLFVCLYVKLSLLTT